MREGIFFDKQFLCKILDFLDKSVIFLLLSSYIFLLLETRKGERYGNREFSRIFVATGSFILISLLLHTKIIFRVDGVEGKQEQRTFENF